MSGLKDFSVLSSLKTSSSLYKDGTLENTFDLQEKSYHNQIRDFYASCESRLLSQILRRNV